MAELRKSSGRKAAVIIVLVLAVAGLAAYLSVTTFDLTGQLPRVQRVVEGRVAGHMTADRLTVKFLPSPDIQITGIEEHLDGERLFGARHLRLRISLLPLIIGRVNIQDIELDGADLQINRNAEGVLNITKFVDVTREKLAKRLHLFTVSFHLMNITDGGIDLSDRRGGESVDFEIRDIKAVVRSVPEGLLLEANAEMAPDTRLSFSGRETKDGVEGEGSLRSLRLERLGPYLREKSPGSAITGTLDLDFVYTGTDVKEFKGTLSYDSLSLSVPDVLAEKLTAKNGSALVSLLPHSPGGAELKIRGINLDLGAFSLLGSFTLGGGDGERGYALELSSTPVALKDLMALASPVLAVPAGGLTPLGGTVRVDSFVIKRPLIKSMEEKTGKLHGIDLIASLDSIKLSHPSLKKPLEELSALVSLKDDALRATNITGKYGKSRITGLDASVTGLSDRDKAAYRLSGSAVLDVNETTKIATEFLKDGGAAALLLSRSEAQGEARLKAEAKGSVKGGLSGAVYFATAEVTGGSFAYRGVPLKLKSIDANAEFNEKTIRNISLKASEGASTLEMSASIKDYREREPRMDIAVKGKAAAATLRALVQGSPFEKETGFEGDINFDVKVKGTPFKADAQVSVDAGEAYIQYKDILDKPPGVKLALDLSAAKEGKRVDIKNASLAFSKGSALSVSGYSSTSMSGYDLTIGADKVLLSDLALLSGYLERGFPSEGLVSLKLHTAKKSALSPASYKGEAKVAGGRFMATAFPKPVESFDASANFDGNKASMSIENLSIGRTRLKARLDIPDIEHKTVDFDITSPALYTSDLLGKKKKTAAPEKEPAKTAPEKAPGPSATEPGQPVRGHGTISVAMGELFGQPFNGLKADVAIEDHVARIQPISMAIDNGRLDGEIAYHTSPLSKNSFDSRFKLTNIDLDAMLKGFGARKEYLSGTANATFELSGKRGAVPFSSGLAGQASIRAEGGRMWKIPVLADIFTLVNILAIDELLKEGMPYREIYADFDMAGGVAVTKNITMESDSMRMSAAGDLNFPAGTMDIVLGVHPFVTIDKIISNIPIAGWLITGKEGSTVSMYFSIKGPFKERKVRPMPIEGIAKGVIGILQRVLEAPVDILKGEIPGEQQKKETRPREPRPEPAR